MARSRHGRADRAPRRPGPGLDGPDPAPCGRTARRRARSRRWCTSPRPAVASRRAVLYVHGFVDYFFQTRARRRARRDGLRPLRARPARLRPVHPAAGRTPNFASTWPPTPRRSTRRSRHHPGARTTTSSCSSGTRPAGWSPRCGRTPGRAPARVDALVLNSPWLDLRGNWFERTVLTPAIDVVGRVCPGSSSGTRPGTTARRCTATPAASGTTTSAGSRTAGFPGARRIRPHASVAGTRGSPAAWTSTCPRARAGLRRGPGPTTDVARRAGHHRLRARRRADQRSGPADRDGRHVRRDPGRRARPRAVPGTRPRQLHREVLAFLDARLP